MWGATACRGLDFWGASVCGGLLAISAFGGLVCVRHNITNCIFIRIFKIFFAIVI